MRVEDAVALMLKEFDEKTYSSTSFDVLVRDGAWKYTVDLKCHGDTYGRVKQCSTLGLGFGEHEDVFRDKVKFAIPQGQRSVAVEAAAEGGRLQREIEMFFAGLCAPDMSRRVLTGASSTTWYWDAPVECAATYHADPAEVARDLALTWIHLHEGHALPILAPLSIDVLRERVAAAPSGAQVPIARYVERILEHHERHDPTPLSVHIPHARVGFPSDALLSRETVLAAMDLPPGVLIEALEASAVPDDEWRAVEPLAQEAIAATLAGAPTYEVTVNSRKHIRFLEQHAHYHVRRLPNGGVMLSTHPYRTLWSLYADALFLLGLRERDEDIP